MAAPTAYADLVVLESEGEEPSSAESTVLSLPLQLRLAPGSVTAFTLQVEEVAVATVVDTLHRCGGDELVNELTAALSQSFRSGDFAHAQRVSAALRLVETARVAQRRDALDALLSIEASTRRVFEHDLTLAAVTLHPRNFGLVLDGEGRASVSKDAAADEGYRRLRAVVADLDAKRRRVRDWSFTIPANAPRARRQFETEVLAPYCEALEAAAASWPAMRVLGSRVVKALAGERGSDIQRWAADAGTATRLDELLIESLQEAYDQLVEEQPGYRADVLDAADLALRTARSLAGRPAWEEAPEVTLGRLHPLWQHPFVVQAALEQQGLRPGDLGHAAATAGLRAAAANTARRRADKAETDRMLGWASLGFGIVSLVPVVGQAALLAMLAITAVQALDHAQTYLADSERRAALGSLAVAYAAAEPDATALLLDLLNLVADAALPAVGKILGGTVLKPTSRVVAATRVRTVLGLGERAADLAAIIAAANASAAQAELERLGLLEPEAGRP